VSSGYDRTEGVTLGWGLRVDLNELRRKGLETEARARRDMKESGVGERSEVRKEER